MQATWWCAKMWRTHANRTAIGLFLIYLSSVTAAMCCFEPTNLHKSKSKHFWSTNFSACHNTYLDDYNLYHFYLHGILQQLLEIYKMARRAFCFSLSFLCALTTSWFANIENWALIRMKSWWNSLMLAQRMLKISDRYTHVWHFK